MIGFSIFAALLLLVFIYPIISPGDPLESIGREHFIKPGTYISLYDAVDSTHVTRLIISDAEAQRLDSKLLPTDREAIVTWLTLFNEYAADNDDYDVEIDIEAIDIEDTEELIGLWWTHYDSAIRISGMAINERRLYQRLDAKLDGLFDSEDIHVYTADPETGEYAYSSEIGGDDYINVNDVVNTRFLPLGTDSFGADMLKKLASAVGTSLTIGLIAGTIATTIGLILGLLGGYLGGLVDDVIMFIMNLFTVIPGFVLLVLISFAISQSQRGAATVALVIGVTSWVWTARSVRSQVISLRTRDHVYLSRLSGHSVPRIVVMDILPYIASYVVMAFVLQISSAILAEAGLAMLGLGPRITEAATLGLMMNWAISGGAYLQGAWWAYYPVLLVIALISFSLNLMNTGLDQIFNPQLRD
uniref:Binding-protein-dependent transport systems inner membrane component n=1 Tax=uncultured bacterium contig00040 TaxID=1181528 RepID=A0A806KMC7_9BACT|nr:binding-protein-dependent transport systems inner membrane component [uncultured bacterium contig00040]